MGRCAGPRHLHWPAPGRIPFPGATAKIPVQGAGLPCQLFILRKSPASSIKWIFPGRQSIYRSIIRKQLQQTCLNSTCCCLVLAETISQHCFCSSPHSPDRHRGPGPGIHLYLCWVWAHQQQPRLRGLRAGPAPWCAAKAAAGDRHSPAQQGKGTLVQSGQWEIFSS